MKETEIIKFKLPLIERLSLVNLICNMGYKATGNKFSVAFNGSKGYMSNIEIYCEGKQSEKNIIPVESLVNKNGSLKSVLINIFHSEQKGVRISIGKDEPKDYTPTKSRLDSLDPGEPFKYNLDDIGIFKIIGKADENWIKTIKTQSGRISGDFPWTEVYKIDNIQA